MKFKKLTASFCTESLALAEEVISHIFLSARLKGVICQIPIPEPDEGFGTQTLEPPETNAIIGYLPETGEPDQTVEEIQEKLSRLSVLGITASLTVETVDEADWAHAWKDHFHVTRITDRIVVRPEWRSYVPGHDEVVIDIDPGMAFGTGTHPTTAMCLEMMETYMVPGNRILDVGCGSGILMIAAAKLGASQLLGIDTDPAAVEISQTNLIKNQVPKTAFQLYATTIDRLSQETFDLVTANIIAQVILEILEEIKLKMAPRATAVLSGIILGKKEEILKAVRDLGLSVVQEKIQGEWVALAIQKT